MTRLAKTDLPRWTLVSGCVFQSVWNRLAGRDPAAGIRDYDVFYFDDTDLSAEAERSWAQVVEPTIKKTRRVENCFNFGDLPIFQTLPWPIGENPIRGGLHPVRKQDPGQARVSNYW